ncbi:MAG: HesB/IscA family protein [Oligoflexales bacterium]
MSSLAIDPKALRKAEEFYDNHPEWKGLSLRVYLSGKGCDGFSYGVSFDQAENSDQKFLISEKITLIVDSDTMTFIDGSTVTWTETEEGEGFIIDNPSHKNFRGKFFKRKDWQERLARAKAARDDSPEDAQQS